LTLSQINAAAVLEKRQSVLKVVRERQIDLHLRGEISGMQYE